jgi:hypothetical protein
MSQLDDANESPTKFSRVMGWGSSNPMILFGLIIILIIGMLYFALRKPSTPGGKKKVVVSAESVKDDEEQVDSLIDEIHDAQTEKPKK